MCFVVLMKNLLPICCYAIMWINLAWRETVEWIGFGNYKARDIKESFTIWYSFGRKAKVRKGKEGVVWLAVIWYLWLVRNDIVFRGA